MGYYNISAYSAGSGTTSVTTGAWTGDANANAGDLVLLFVNSKNSGTTPSTPAFYNLLFTGTGGTGVNGEDTGLTRATVFWTRILTPQTLGSITVTHGSGNVTNVIAYRLSPTGSIPLGDPISGGTASDSTSNSSLSFTFSSAPSIGKDDGVLVFGALTDTTTSISAQAATQTGATLTWQAQIFDSTTFGNNVLSVINEFKVTGTSSTNSLTFTATGGGGSGVTSGTGGLVVIREAKSFAPAGESVHPNDGLTSQDKTATLTGETVSTSDTHTLLAGADLTISSSETISLADSGGGTFSGDGEALTLTETESTFISNLSIVFNGNEQSPGYDITVTGANLYDSVTVFRRDVYGLYPDEKVRGIDSITSPGAVLVATDFEAPLGTPLEYYIILGNAGGTITAGPYLPTGLPYIPIQRGPYGESDYIKSIDTPTASRRVFVEDFADLTSSANTLGTYHVLGRRNPVKITDVMGGYEGSMVVTVITTVGSAHTYREIDSLLKEGDTLLFQSANSDSSTIADFYFKVDSVSRGRLTIVSREGRESVLDDYYDVAVRYTIKFTETDRPPTLGASPTLYSWNTYYAQVYDDWQTWDEVLADRSTWLDVLNRAGLPKE